MLIWPLSNSRTTIVWETLFPGRILLIWNRVRPATTSNLDMSSQSTSISLTFLAMPVPTLNIRYWTTMSIDLMRYLFRIFFSTKRCASVLEEDPVLSRLESSSSRPCALDRRELYVTPWHGPDNAMKAPHKITSQVVLPIFSKLHASTLC